MGNNGTSFTVVIGGGGDGLIQAAQGQWRSIASQGCGVQWARPIERQQRVPPDEWGDNLDGNAIAESNARWRWQNQNNDQIGLRHDAAMTTLTTTKGGDDHNKEDPPVEENT
jgi:hypothetical protein